MADIKLRNIVIENAPGGYEASPGLIHAVEVAYALKRPLLLSGEPGTGKSEFARWVAQALPADAGFDTSPLVFNTKSTSTAQDLFYFYDAISHFRDTKLESNNWKLMVQHYASITGQAIHTSYLNKSAADYIELRALGLAFEKATGKKLIPQDNGSDGSTTPGTPPEKKGSVVLIDEIDKAPRDFPNDLLNEIERYEFWIKELNIGISLNDEEKQHILIILTSNFEKNLPEAFLRRCVYFHIEFPKKPEMLKIVQKRLHFTDAQLAQITQRIDEFFRIKDNQSVQKKPSTSELLDYIRILLADGTTGLPLLGQNNRATRDSEKYLSLLLKKREDRELYMAPQT
jgi:MoxR-like ATPase